MQQVTVRRMEGSRVAGLPPVPAAEDNTFVLEDVVAGEPGRVHHLLGYAGDAVRHLAERWLVVDTARAG
ncbi:hypothetical protein ABVB69_37155 [Streptomyces sp. NPDC000349]|uniref:hypothetical protein n=1 Tax=Streptomyces sp. NPDC000349 TaxID=3154249 RepID=UPI00336ADD66